MIFHLHGPLAPDSPLFVGREEELVRIERWLQRGDAVGAVLGGRQNGKTSVLLRARERAWPWQPVAFVDFQAVAGADPAACARHIAEQIAEQLGGTLTASPARPDGAGGLQVFLRATANAAQTPRLGVFLDELGVLPEETRRWLGSALRASFNLRLVHRELSRWTFVLAGGIELCDMAVHRNSPLRNVLDEIYLGDLSESAVAALLDAAAAPGLPASRAAELHAWTAGHPYLTQALAEEAARSGSIVEGAAALLRIETHNLPHVFHTIDREGLEPVFRRIVAQEPIPFTRLDDDVARLELCGVLRDEAGLCRPRNRLYAEAARRRYGITTLKPARAPRRRFQAGHALLIGVGTYLVREDFEDLPATERDARALEEVLLDDARCGYEPERVRAICGAEATGEEIRRGLRDLAARSDAGSTVVVYFSGHGARVLRDGGWRTYLCPREAELARIDETAIAEDELSNQLARIPAARLVVILDTCHAGGSATLKASSAPWRRGHADDDFAALTCGRGRVVIASCRENQRSRVEGELSLFTRHLRDALRGEAAVRGDGLVRVLDVYAHVSDRLGAANVGQTPVFKAQDMDDNFAIALAPERSGPSGPV